MRDIINNSKSYSEVEATANKCSDLKEVRIVADLLFSRSCFTNFLCPKKPL